MHHRLDNSRHIAAPTGTELSCRSWTTEAAMRMLMNNLDPDVAEKPGELVVYGGVGRAAHGVAVQARPEAGSLHPEPEHDALHARGQEARR